MHCFRSISIPAGLLAAALLAAPVLAAEAAPIGFAEVNAGAESALARGDLADYRGWIKFLRFEAETAISRHGAGSAAAQGKVTRLADWVRRINENPHLIASLEGVQEWAYESPVDGSGQPFKIAIPSDHDPKRPTPLSVYMHGYLGSHLDHSEHLVPRPGEFEVAVLGRSRGGNYRALSEADVLHVVDYIQAHWSIDPDRIHLKGGSMGGYGSFRLGSRYPHRWASSRPTCGYASFIPIENLLTLPVYAVHSADDPVVSVLHARGPMARLRARGGQAILDETNGLGHAAWDYVEGNARSEAWMKQQVRPDSRSIRHIDYTAVDGGAVRGWWAEIVEWGDAPKPARFVLSVGAANTVHAGLTNIARLKFRLPESPLDRTQPLNVAIDGGAPITLSAPLPESVTLVRSGQSWNFETASQPPPYRLHTPGSASLLYNGEPLLIVYGTRGTETEVTAMRKAAEAASKSPNPVWLDDSGDVDADGVSTVQNLYGRLTTKADTDVTDSDIARCHLVVIGTEAQNALVARLAPKLPVRFADEAIVCSDGVEFPGKNNVLGLVHYNPLAPERLIFWVAAQNSDAYRARSVVTEMIGGGFRIASEPSATDLIVTEAGRPTLVAARSFDSRWNWHRGRETSPVLAATLQSSAELSAAIASALRRAAAADFVLLRKPKSPDEPAIAVGIARVSDVAARFFYNPVGTVDLSGAELAQVASRLADPNAQLVLYGAAGDAGVQFEPTRSYRLAMPAEVAGPLTNLLKFAPQSYRHTDLSFSDAIERFLGRP